MHVNCIFVFATSISFSDKCFLYVIKIVIFLYKIIRGIKVSQFINIGFGNYILCDKIISVVRADSAPIKRLVQNAKDTGLAVDATQGRKTKSVIVTTDNHVVLSSLLPETITSRCQ